MIDKTVLDPLLSRPDLPQLAASINQVLREEAHRRKLFRRDLSPDVKAEFIAGQVVTHSPAKAKHLRVSNKLVCLLSAFVGEHQYRLAGIVREGEIKSEVISGFCIPVRAVFDNDTNQKTLLEILTPPAG